MQTLSSKLSILLSLIIAFSSCSFNKHREIKDFIEPNEVAFLEYFQTQEGEVLSGKTTEGRRIDGPTYRFDIATKKLELLRKENFSIDTVKVILGNGRILKGSSGTGLSMRVNIIGKLPYTMNNLTVSEVSNKGIRLIFEKKELLLKEGEEWHSSSVSIDTIKAESPAIVKTTTTNSIHYFGKLDKNKITQ